MLNPIWMLIEINELPFCRLRGLRSAV